MGAEMNEADFWNALISDASSPNLALTVLSIVTLVWAIIDSLLGKFIASPEVRSLRKSVNNQEKIIKVAMEILKK